MTGSGSNSGFGYQIPLSPPPAHRTNRRARSAISGRASSEVPPTTATGIPRSLRASTRGRAEVRTDRYRTATSPGRWPSWSSRAIRAAILRASSSGVSNAATSTAPGSASSRAASRTLGSRAPSGSASTTWRAKRTIPGRQRWFSPRATRSPRAASAKPTKSDTSPPRHW